MIPRVCWLTRAWYDACFFAAAMMMSIFDRVRPSQTSARPPGVDASRLVVIDKVLDARTCRMLIDEADIERWVTSTAEITRVANGPHTCPPRRVDELDQPCRLVGSDAESGGEERPRFAVLDAPRLALRLFYRLVHQLPLARARAQLAGLKPLLRCIEYRRGEGTDAHCDPVRETPEGHRSQFSVLVFLNDRFAGGAVEFPEIGRRVEARAGRAVIFPHDMLHRDCVVERGRKFVLETEVFYSEDWDAYPG